MDRLPHDSQGFLTGDRTELGRAISIWTTVRNDVKAIKAALVGQARRDNATATVATVRHREIVSVVRRRRRERSAEPTPEPVQPRARARRTPPARREEPITPGRRQSPEQTQPRDASGRFTRAAPPVPPTPEPDQSPTPRVRRRAEPSPVPPTPRPPRTERTATPRRRPRSEPVPPTPPTPDITGPGRRDPNGRFTRQQVEEGAARLALLRQQLAELRAKKKKEDDEKKEKDGSGLEKVADRITGAIAETAEGTEQIDATVQAAKEIATPITRGYQLIFGNREERRKEGWFKKILRALNLSRKEESVYQRESTRLLREIDEIERNRGGESGGGLGLFRLLGAGGIGALLMTVARFAVMRIPLILAAWAGWKAFNAIPWKRVGATIESGWDTAMRGLQSAWENITSTWNAWIDGGKSFFSGLTQKYDEFWEGLNTLIREKTGVDIKGVKEKVVGRANAYVREKTGVDVAKTVERVRAAGAGAWARVKGAAREVFGGGPAQSQPPTESTQQSGGFYDAIIKAEGTGKHGDPYETSLGYRRSPKPLTQMTMREALEWGEQIAREEKARLHVSRKKASSARGAFQIVNSTQKEAMKALGIGMDEPFSRENQRRMADWIVKRQGLRAWEGFKVHPEQRSAAEQALRRGSMPAPARATIPPAPTVPTPAAPPAASPSEPLSMPLGSGADVKTSLNVSSAGSPEPGQDLSDRGIAHIVTGGYARV